MAGAVIIATGWASFNTGAAFGSLGYTYLPQEPRQNLATPQPRLLVIYAGLIAINGLFAHWHNSKEAARGHYDISSFAFQNYVIGLASTGYVLSISLCYAFFRCLNQQNYAELPLMESSTETFAKSRGMCSLYAFLLCLASIPLSGPIALLFIEFVAH
jgi:hypothetical protein